jgi:hypothetical protein
LVVLLPGEPMHDDDTIIIFQADHKAHLGDHQSIMANGRVRLCFSLVALSAASGLTTISADTDVINILSAAVQRRTSSSEQAKDQAISAQPKLIVVRGLTSNMNLGMDMFRHRHTVRHLRTCQVVNERHITAQVPCSKIWKARVSEPTWQ